MKNLILSQKITDKDLALLVIRCALGLLLCYHGLDKLLNYSTYVEYFPDPIGLGASTSLGLAIFAELIGGLALAFGLLTRFFLIPIFVTMSVVFFIVHAPDPFNVKELALSYWLLSIGLFISGPGDYSLDRFILKKGKS